MEVSEKSKPVELSEEELKAASEGRSAEIFSRAKPVFRTASDAGVSGEEKFTAPMTSTKPLDLTEDEVKVASEGRSAKIFVDRDKHA